MLPYDCRIITNTLNYGSAATRKTILEEVYDLVFFPITLAVLKN